MNKAGSKTEHGSSDLRYCLELKSNYEIAKCAEPPSVIINSLSGNGFGVVAKVVGKIVIGKTSVQFHPHVIELRSSGTCAPDCPTINSVSFSLTRDHDNLFSSEVESDPIPVNQKLPDVGNLAIKIPVDRSQIELSFKDRKLLASMRLTLEIHGELKDQGKAVTASWYSHSEPLAFELGIKPVLLKVANETNLRQSQAQEAILKGQVKDLKRILQSGVDVNVRDADGKTMLMRAAERGDLKAVKLLLEYGANVNDKTAVDKNGNGAYTALHAAMKQDSVGVVDMLVRAGADTQAAANQVWTPVHYAAYLGAVKSIRYLHKHDVGIDQISPGASKSTPLMMAAQYEQISAIKVLLELGADPKRKDLYGEDACSYAKFYGKAASSEALGCK